MRLVLVFIISFSICSRSQAQELPNRPFKVSFAKDKIILPITYRNGANPIIEVMVNGKGPYRFMFDTGGAGMARLDIRLFNEWGLKATDSIRAGDGSGQNDRWLPVVNLESIALQDYLITTPAALVRNYNTRAGSDLIDGVIGLGFFEQSLVEFDFEQSQLIIRKGKLTAGDKNIVPIQVNDGVPLIPVLLGGKTIEANFDTGNTGGLTFHSSDIPNTLIEGEARVVGRAKTLSNTFEIKEAQLNVPVRIGDLVFDKPVIQINDLLPTANIGIRFAKQMKITVDITNKLMRIEKAAPKREPAAVAVGKYGDYVGAYEGGRTISVDKEGSLYIQRLAGTKLKMTEKSQDAFGLEIVPQAEFRFVRDAGGRITAIKVSNDGGAHWETAEKK
jgi:hypothetical protein